MNEILKKRKINYEYQRTKKRSLQMVQLNQQMKYGRNQYA